MMSAKKLRKDTFKEVTDHAKYMEGPVDVTIGGDCDQDIALIKVQQFL